MAPTAVTKCLQWDDYLNDPSRAKLIAGVVGLQGVCLPGLGLVYHKTLSRHGLINRRPWSRSQQRRMGCYDPCSQRTGLRQSRDQALLNMIVSMHQAPCTFT